MKTAQGFPQRKRKGWRPVQRRTDRGQKSMEQAVLDDTFGGAKIWGSDYYLRRRLGTFFKHGFCSRKSISPAFLRKFSKSCLMSLFLRRFQNPRSLVRRGNLYPILRSRKIKSSELEEFTLPYLTCRGVITPHPTMGALPPSPRRRLCKSFSPLGGVPPKPPVFQGKKSDLIPQKDWIFPSG